MTKAAGSHYLLIAALAKAGLKFKDIEPAYLTPADGRAAFEKGAVDAWVTWDPFVAAVQKQSDVRILADGTGLASYQRYYLASKPFAAAEPKVLKTVFDQLKGAGEWIKANPADAAKLLGPVWGLDPAIVETANSRRSYQVREVTRRRARRAAEDCRHVLRRGSSAETGKGNRRGDLVATEAGLCTISTPCRWKKPRSAARSVAFCFGQADCSMLRVARVSLTASATRKECAATSGTPISSPNVARASGPAIKSVGTGRP